jgi:hypothetical protein
MRLNLSQHTLPSDKLALSYESPDALDSLKTNLRAEQQPVNETEEILVNEMAEQFWRLRRSRVLETSLLDSDKVMIPHLAAIQRMMSSAERGFHKALTALRQLQKDRGFVPAKSVAEPAKLDEPEPPVTDPRPGVQGAPALARKRAIALTVDRSQLSAPSGFVPPPCPSDEDIDPADWARAFAARHRVHAKVSS